METTDQPIQVQARPQVRGLAEEEENRGEMKKETLEKKRREEMLRIEQQVVGYYRRNPSDQCDGSFTYGAFLLGYRAGVRDIKKKGAR